MINARFRSTDRSSIAILSMFGLFIGCITTSTAQQLDLNAASAGRSVSNQIPVEYATIGSVTLPIQVLGLDRAAGGNGQVASNQQIGDRNTSQISQTGAANAAAIRIVGDANTGRITQTGTGNVGQGTLNGTEIQFDLRQNGSGNQADLRVNGMAGTDLAIRQEGNRNAVTASVPSGGDLTLNQVGGGLSLNVIQSGAARGVSVQQFRAQ